MCNSEREKLYSQGNDQVYITRSSRILPFHKPTTKAVIRSPLSPAGLDLRSRQRSTASKTMDLSRAKRVTALVSSSSTFILCPSQRKNSCPVIEGRGKGDAKDSRSRGTSTQYMCVRLPLRAPTQLRNGNWRQVIAWHLSFKVALQSEQVQPSTATDTARRL
jgi:hypothetical protein